MLTTFRGIVSCLPAIFTLGVIPYSRSISLKAEWVRMDQARKVSPRRSGHIAFTSLDDGTPVPYIFGGYVEEDGDGPVPNRYVKNDLWTWREENGGWKNVEHRSVHDDLPNVRLAAAAAVVNNKAYLFGGWDPQTPGTGGVILDSVHELDLESMSWRKLDLTCPDGPTSHHVAVTLPNRDLILLHNRRCTDHVILFDPSTETFTKQATTGSAPSSRRLHAAAVVGDDNNRVLIFGGAAQDGTMSNEVFLLDTRNWEWTRLSETSGPSPSPRASPCLCAYNKDCVLLFGGAETGEAGLNPRGDLWALHLKEDCDRQQWELLLPDDRKEEDGIRPPPRNAASLVQVPAGAKNECGSSGGKSFLLTGGWFPFKRTWDDCYVLRVLEAQEAE